MQAVILAAGDSSRFWPLNEKHKSLIKLLGQPLIAFLVQEIKRAGVRDIVIVQSPSRQIEKTLNDKSLKFAIQKKPTGTGDALLAARRFIKDDHFLLFNADDQDVAQNLKSILKIFWEKKIQALLLASPTKTPWMYGILKTKGKRVLEIVEKPKIGRAPGNLKNDNFFLLPKEFLNYLKKVPSHPFSLIHALNLYARANPFSFIRTPQKTLSLKFPWDIFAIMKKRMNAPAFKKKIAKSARIGKGVVVEGRVVIGEGAKIGHQSVIFGPAYIGPGCKIGPRNVIRGPVNLEENVQTGAFMEIKGSIVQPNTHFHSGVLSDSIVGSNCRFGAEFCAANRRLDRKNIFSCVKSEKTDTNLTFLGTAVGQGSRIGIKVGTMPGVFIGKNCVIWPGVLVFKNVEDNATLKKNENR